MNNILGGIFGLILDLEPYKRYFFAGLAGIFLYTSLCSIFPVINDILNECRQHTIEMKGQLSAEDMKTLRSKEILRIFIVNFGFFSALGFMAPLVSQCRGRFQCRISSLTGYSDISDSFEMLVL